MLSESYLCIIVHNLKLNGSTPWLVVNCFQNRIFALSFTTNRGRLQELLVVNCFQNRIFALSFTTILEGYGGGECCELLSESYLCIIVHNFFWTGHLCTWLWIAFRIVSLHYRSQRMVKYYFIIRVVNCFQNRIFALSFTTRHPTSRRLRELWIAFRIVSLHYRSQPISKRVHFC